MFNIDWVNGYELTLRNSYCIECGTKLIGDGYCPRCCINQKLTPYLGVAVVVFRDDMVLLGRRIAAGFNGGMWSLPCGFVEFNENVIDAAIRECKEETGLEIEIEEIVGVFDCCLSQNRHTVTIAFWSNIVGSSEKAGSDIDEIKWFPIGSLPEEQMAFHADIMAIKCAAEMRCT